MCNFELRGREGMLLKKDTGWLTDVEEVLHQVAKPCSGNHEHEACMGGNAKRAQVYTRALARAVVKGLLHALRARGDERFVLPVDSGARFGWVCSTEVSTSTSSCWTTSSWVCAGDMKLPIYEVFYLDIDRNEQAWIPGRSSDTT